MEIFNSFCACLHSCARGRGGKRQTLQRRPKIDFRDIRKETHISMTAEHPHPFLRSDWHPFSPARLARGSFGHFAQNPLAPARALRLLGLARVPLGSGSGQVKTSHAACAKPCTAAIKPKKRGQGIVAKPKAEAGEWKARIGDRAERK